MDGKQHAGIGRALNALHAFRQARENREVSRENLNAMATERTDTRNPLPADHEKIVDSFIGETYERSARQWEQFEKENPDLANWAQKIPDLPGVMAAHNIVGQAIERNAPGAGWIAMAKIGNMTPEIANTLAEGAVLANKQVVAWTSTEEVTRLAGIVTRTTTETRYEDPHLISRPSEPSRENLASQRPPPRRESPFGFNR